MSPPPPRFLFALLIALASPLAVAQSDGECPDPVLPGEPCPEPRSEGFQNTHQIYAERIRAGEQVSPMGSDLFGDSTSLYSGATEFSVVDLDIPGNSGLPVQVRRQFKVESRKTGAPLGGFGAWNIDVPYIMGMFDAAPANQWNLNSAVANQPPGRRCSVRFEPTASTLELREVWNGYHVHIPGQGDQEMLWYQTTMRNQPEPSNGKYRWTTRDEMRFRCIEAPEQLPHGYLGEGFIGVDTNGTEYRFDTFVHRQNGSLRRPVNGGSIQTNRVAIYALASQVKDRHGHWVNYTYTATGQLTQISSSDGRTINFVWDPTGQRITSASTAGPGGSTGDQARTRSYTYRSNDLGNSASGLPIERVTRGDGTFWQYTYSGDTILNNAPLDPTLSNCVPPDPSTAPFTLVIRHPAGAVGTFTFEHRQHYRSGVDALSCSLVDTNGTHRMTVADHFDTYALVSKRIDHFSDSQPTVGLPSQLWTFTYPHTNLDHRYPLASFSGIYPCPFPGLCPPSKVVTVTHPDGSSVDHTFGVRFSDNEGRLLSTTTRVGGTVLRTETNTYVTDAEAATHPYRKDYGIATGEDDRVARIRPVKETTISQQGINFKATTTAFDTLARPLTVVRGNAELALTRTESTRYHDNLATWTMGQVARRWDDSSCPGTCSTPTGVQLIEETTYDPTSSLPTHRYAFGLQTERRTYHGLASQKGLTWQIHDAGNRLQATLDNYHRGIPRLITYPQVAPDLVPPTESATVNYHGEIATLTNAVGGQTVFQHDTMGRLVSIQYPAGGGPAWNATSITFTHATPAQFDLPAGHYQQTVATGTARTVTHFDALWRPVLTRSWDTANETGTQRVTLRKFDHAGREVFASYPQAAINGINTAVTGTATTIDALGRPTHIVANSEIGNLTSRYFYESGFTTRFRNARNIDTITSFRAYDQPDTRFPEIIVRPEGTTTTIARDTWGKPLAITRSGSSASGSHTLTRNFVYDAHQRLCMRHDPESGWHIRDYDGNNNLAGTADGQLVGQTHTTCQPAAGAQRSARTYDVRNRLTTVNHPETVGDLAYTYHPDGALRTLAVGTLTGTTLSSPTSTWTYTYNPRRLLLTETLTLPGHTAMQLTRGYDGNGHPSTLTYPDSTSIALTPNALGQPRTAGAYASNASYHPSGALAGFNYGSGAQHSTTLNTRQLPLNIRDTMAGVLIDYTHHYDANGNLTWRQDFSGNNETRDMQYDALDRLVYTNAPGLTLGGTAEYGYDALDNLRTVSYAGFGGRQQFDEYSYDGRNRLSNIQLEVPMPNPPPVPPPQTTLDLPYSHDDRGNVYTRTTNDGSTPIYHSYTFDRANRMLTATKGSVTEHYQYDGHGRRTRIDRGSNNVTLQMYALDGTFLYEVRPDGVPIKHIHLGKRLVASVTGSVPVYTHLDALGSVVRRSASNGIQLGDPQGGRSIIEPYGSLSGGAWIQGPGFTGHVADLASGLTYMQQRYQDPGAMRFLSVDPVHVDPGTGENFNRYWYANNNPYRYVDPDGRQACGKDIECRIKNGQSPGSINGGISGARDSAATPQNAPRRLQQADAYVRRNEDRAYGFKDQDPHQVHAHFQNLFAKISQLLQIEFGANIVGMSGEYGLQGIRASHAFDPATGIGYSVAMIPPRSGLWHAFTHTHPSSALNLRNPHFGGFSDGDIGIAADRRKNMYVGLPDGSSYFYQHSSNTVSCIWCAD